MVNREQIVVVGGAGYLGGAVVRELVVSGYRVTVVDDLSQGLPVQTQAADQLIRLDVRDRSALTAILSHRRPAVVVHLGGRHSLRASMERPEVCFEANVGGTAALLGAMFTSECKKLVLGSDIAVYGDGHEGFPETDPCEPRTPHACSLLAVERLAKSCGDAWGLETAILRFAQLGGRDLGPEGPLSSLPENPVDRLLLAAKRNRERHPFELDQPDRALDLIHVDDAANAVVLAVNALVEAESLPPVMNISRGSVVRISELVTRLEEISGRPIHIVRRPAPPWLAITLAASNELAASALGWKPERSIRDILSDGWSQT